MDAPLDPHRWTQRVIAAIPTRGLIFTETIQAVLRELADVGCPGEVVFSTGLPIPTAHNRVCEEALERGADVVWLVEEDVAPPLDVLRAMLTRLEQTSGPALVACDVPSPAGDGNSMIKRHPPDERAEIWWTHTACTLIPRAVFERVPRPWFVSDYFLDYHASGDQLVWERVPSPTGYGQHDVEFGFKCREHGVRLVEVPFTAKHCRVIAYAQKGRNDGCHEIASDETITQRHI